MALEIVAAQITAMDRYFAIVSSVVLPFQQLQAIRSPAATIPFMSETA